MKLLKFLGDVFVVSLIILGLMAACHDSKATTATSWTLMESAFTSDRGHAGLGTYTFVSVITGIPTQRECLRMGQDYLDNFHAPVLGSGARLIPAYSCEGKP